MYPPCAADCVRPYLFALSFDKNVPADLCRPEIVDLALAMLNAATFRGVWVIALSSCGCCAPQRYVHFHAYLYVNTDRPKYNKSFGSVCRLSFRRASSRPLLWTPWGIYEFLNYRDHWSSMTTTASTFADFCSSDHFCGNSSSRGEMVVAVPERWAHAASLVTEFLHLVQPTRRDQWKKNSPPHCSLILE